MAKVLITGGSGFLGRSLARELRDGNEVVLTSRNQKALMAASKSLSLESAPLDVVNYASAKEIFLRYRPEIIVHAAATKFVDLAEKFPSDCIDNNVIGSLNVARAAVEVGVRQVIGISTDKAAPPVANIYGLTKATMERLFLSLNGKSNTNFSIVRYGNVAWSTGSVFPIWKSMINENGHIESTGPDMSRFFFSVDDAVNLIVGCMNYQEICAGNILSLPMKGTLIKRILEIWSARDGFTWSEAKRRVGDRGLEFLIGETETLRTRQVNLGTSSYFLMSGREEEVENHLTEAYSSLSAEQMSDQEILALVDREPEAN